MLKNIPLTEEDLNVKGNLKLANTEITSLPEGLKVGGYLDLSKCKSLTSLPKGLKVDNNLHIKKTPLEKFSDDELLDMIKPDGFIKGEIKR